MPRRSTGPRYYASKNAWFANINKEQIKLVEGPKKETEEQAQKKYDQLVAVRKVETAGDRSETWAVLNKYLTGAKTRTFPEPLAPSTYRMHELAINDFIGFEYEGKKCGLMPVRDLRNAHFQAWLAARKEGRWSEQHKKKLRWSDDYALMNLNVLKTAFKWAATEGEIIGVSPFDRKGKKGRTPMPSPGLKRLSTSDEEHAALYAQADMRRNKNFRDLLQLLYDTGARPAELYMARAEEWNAELQALVIDPADRRNVGRLKVRRHLLRQGRKRVIRVPDHLVPMVQRWRAEYPDGPMFRTEDGKVWRAKTIASRFRTLVAAANSGTAKSVKLPVRKGLSLYSYRHAYVSRWLKRGDNVMTLCEVLNTSLTMLKRHYSHLFEDHAALLEAVNRASTPAGGPPRSHQTS